MKLIYVMLNMSVLVLLFTSVIYQNANNFTVSTDGGNEKNLFYSSVDSDSEVYQGDLLAGRDSENPPI